MRMSRSMSARRKDVEVAGRAELVRRAQVRAMRRLLLRWRETARELPESPGNVLGWVTWMDGRHFMNRVMVIWYDEKNGWWSDYLLDGWVVTHWMPLPEPPEGRREEEEEKEEGGADGR